MKMSEDQEGVHLSIPKPAVDILKGFKPALESLLKLISYSNKSCKARSRRGSRCF
ncbi:MAG: hypothetical protein HY796_03420 [Elusimicrobia bacterium]|nr:hypothetical protein [Elusimicrobiota bacterium]